MFDALGGPRRGVRKRLPRRRRPPRWLVILGGLLLCVSAPPIASVAEASDLPHVVAGAAPAAEPGTFVSRPPVRILDSRTGNGFSGAVAAGATVHLQVLGRGGLPASGVGALVMNVTVTQPQRGGFITVYPDGGETPNASNVNFVSGQTVANLVMVQIGAGGKVALRNSSSGSVHLVGDVSGYYTAGSPTVPGAFVTLAPQRVLDSRTGNGSTGPIPAGGTVHLQVLGRGGVPLSGVSAVVMNTTVTQPNRAGYMTAYPDGTSRPTASNVNFVAGQTVPNLVTVKVGTNGKVALTNMSGGKLHLVADISGYYLAGTPTAAGAYVSLAPKRVLDSRSGNGDNGPIAGGRTSHVRVMGRGGVPRTKVAAVIVNLTVVAPTRQGHVTAYPDRESLPNSSNINFAAKATVANLTITQVPVNGRIGLRNGSAGAVDLVGDVAGYFLEPVTHVQQLASGLEHTCALAGGEVSCWGSNYRFATGNNYDANSVTPEKVKGLPSGIVDISASGLTSCALSGAGAVWCWGATLEADAFGGPQIDPKPLAIQGLASGVVAIADSCAVMSNGTVKCWGSNSYGQLGNGDSDGQIHAIATQVMGLPGPVEELAANIRHRCARVVDTGVYCWGYDQVGIDSAEPTLISGSADITHLVAGATHTCGLNVDKPVCWGEAWALGTGTMASSATPKLVAGNHSAKDLAAGVDATCALTTADEYWCWGSPNQFGELGNGTPSDPPDWVLSPVLADELSSNARGVSLGDYHGCATLTSGGAQCWGSNYWGQLGDGGVVQEFSPKPVTVIGF